jgi:PBP1b-binding outer membrane lipoprotein LpoB
MEEKTGGFDMKLLLTTILLAVVLTTGCVKKEYAPVPAVAQQPPDTCVLKSKVQACNEEGVCNTNLTYEC